MTAASPIIRGIYLGFDSGEMVWREDNRRLPNGAQYERIAGLAMKRGPSVDFCGYWQRHLGKAA